jgi:hypothetical protein
MVFSQQLLKSLDSWREGSRVKAGEREKEIPLTGIPVLNIESAMLGTNDFVDYRSRSTFPPR